MKASDIPAKFQVPFADQAGAGFRRTIPQASQIGIQDGAASLVTGFVPDNFLPVGAGGVPPFGQDMNGILWQDTAWARWQAAGGAAPYDGTFSTGIGGYPQGAIIPSATILGKRWISLIDDNASNPDAGGANWAQFGRIRLTADTTFYVSTAGSDSNDGLTVGTPWLTPQHAAEVLMANYDAARFNITVQYADSGGTYGPVAVSGLIPGQGTLTFNGNVGSPSNVVVNNVGGPCFFATRGANIIVQGFKVTGSGGASGLLTGAGGSVISFNNMNFGTMTGGFHLWTGAPGTIGANGPYTISGGAAAHFNAAGGLITVGGITVTITGTPAFSTEFAACGQLGFLQVPGMTFIGGATGKRYDVSLNGVINTNGAGATYLPGNSAGTTGTGGQYN